MMNRSHRFGRVTARAVVRVGGVLGALATIAVFGAWRASQPGRLEGFCRPPSTLVGQHFLSQMIWWGSSPDTSTANFRAAIHLRGTPAANIIAITDEKKCSRASRALDSAVFRPARSSSLYLVQVGRDYMALPPNTIGIIVHLNGRFTFQNKIVMQ
jgi:hypothetical protein